MCGKMEISVCLGSSCFSRGNKQIVQVIQEYVSKQNLNNQVELKGAHCFSNCVNGPVIKINDNEFHSIDKDKIVNIFESYITKQV